VKTRLAENEFNEFVFIPLRENSKEPAIRSWDSLTKDELSALVQRHQGNIGVRTDPPLFIVDIDDHRLRRLIEEDFPQTLTVKTRRGYHYYFIASGRYPKPNKKSKLIQLLAGECYGVFPPSIVDGHEYGFEVKAPIAKLDDRAVEKLERIIDVIAEHESLILKLSELWTEGHRHRLSLWLNGCLRKAGFERFDSAVIVKTICLLAGDEELRDRLEALRTTFERPLNEVGGWSYLRRELEAIVGPERAKEILDLIPHRDTDGNNVELQPQTLADLISNAKPFEWVVDRFLPRRGLVVLAGKAGSGKSLLCLHLAFCLAEGKPFLGLLETKSSRVLIIDGENYPTTYVERVKLLGISPNSNIEAVVLSDFSLDNPRWLKALERAIAERKYGVIILDPWTALIHRLDENKAGEVSTLLTRLRKIAYEYDCAFLLVHHLRKGLPYSTEPLDELRGSSVLVNEPDLVFLLRSNSATRVLKGIKMRYGGELSLTIDFKQNDGGLVIDATEMPTAEVENEVVRCGDAILDYLQLKKNAATRRELIEELGYSEKTVQRALNMLVSLGRIKRLKRGVYKIAQTELVIPTEGEPPS